MPGMENGNGGLPILEGSLPTIEWKTKETGGYAR